MRYFSGFLVHGYSITFNSLLSGRSRRRFIIPLCRACSSSISCNILSRNLAVIRLLGATPPIACESCCLFSADLGKNAAMGLDGSVEPGTLWVAFIVEDLLQSGQLSKKPSSVSSKIQVKYVL